MVCIGQPVLIAGDLNADPAVIPCLAKGISAGRHVDLALAFSLGAGLTPDAGLVGRRVLVLVEISLLAVLMRWLLQMLVLLLIGGSPLISLFLLASALMLGWLMLLARLYVSLSGLLVGWILLIGSSSSATRVVQDVWDVHRDELGEIPGKVVLALRNAVSRSSVDDFWTI